MADRPISWPAPETTASERQLRGRALALLWVTGTTLLVLSVVVPDRSGIDEPELLTVCGVAYAFAAVMYGGSGRLPRWTFDVALAGGNVLISVLAHTTGGAESPYALFYLWQVVYGFYFLPLPRAVIQLGVAAAGFTIAVFLEGGGDVAIVRWLLTLSTLVVVAALVGALRRHVQTLVSQLSDLARVDQMTGVANRRGFDEVLHQESRRAARSGRPFSLILGDIDHFKEVNDRHGHPAGDRVLAHVARMLQDGTREVDLVARIGGEEFAIVAPDTPIDQAEVTAERLREALASTPAPGGIELTTSFGVAEGVDGPSAMQAADRALYLAKERGRNRTELAPRTPTG
jgi:diguanylate cyclase (GGDEF)-like protein